MKKKSFLLGFGVAAGTIAIAVSSIVISKASSLKTAKGVDDYYSISFTAADIFDVDRQTSGGEVEAYYETGTKVLKTDQLHNDVTIGYNNCYRYDFNGYSYFEVKKNYEGAIYNVTPINSITSITVRLAGGFKMEWGWEAPGGVIQYLDYTTANETNDDRTFDFAGYHPNYFRISCNNVYNSKQLGNFVIKYDKDCVLGESPYVDKDGIRYKKYGTDAYEVVGFAGASMATLNIPDTVNDLPVTRIGAVAFKNDTTITSLTLPNQLRVIENDAFNGCSNIGAIEIPNTVVSIRDRAFNGTSGCTSLTFEAGGTSTLDLCIAAFQDNGHTGVLTLPKRISGFSYDGYTFVGCPNITEFALNNDDVQGNIALTEDGVLFSLGSNYDYNAKVLVSYPAANARQTYAIPVDCSRVGTRDGLSGAHNLKKLIIQNNVDLYFGASSASDLANLEEVEFATTTNQVIFYWYAIEAPKLSNFVVPTNVLVRSAGFASLENTSTTPRNIYFDGSTQDLEDANWDANWDGSNGTNDKIKILTRSDAEPATDAEKLTMWHYVDGNPVPWLKQMKIDASNFNDAGNIYAFWGVDSSEVGTLYLGTEDNGVWTINVPGELSKFVILRLDPAGAPYTNGSTSWPTDNVWNQSNDQTNVVWLEFIMDGYNGGQIYGHWA
ncbi:MAG: leucine-rich repeat domain-containing protein [Bacilli bacterium]|nr:leucine-rich repeat domain-containing protein [Bacilli bacterium]